MEQMEARIGGQVGNGVSRITRAFIKQRTITQGAFIEKASIGQDL